MKTSKKKLEGRTYVFNPTSESWEHRNRFFTTNATTQNRWWPLSQPTQQQNQLQQQNQPTNNNIQTSLKNG